jgi:predicted ATPase
MRILRLQLENWRNFTKVDVRIQQRVFIVGPNASGKSNFLDAIRFLQDVSSVGGGLQNAVRDRGGVSKIRCLAARRYPDVVIEIDLGVDPENPEWTYRIAFKQDNQRRPILKKELVLRNGNMVLERPDSKDQDDAERLTQTHLEQVSANFGFREVADFFGSVRYLHVIPHLIRDSELHPPRKDKARDPFGGDFLEQIARTPVKTRESRLRKIRQALTIAIPQLKELVLERDKYDGTPHLSGRSEHWRPNAGWQREDQFSDGTLRLMGLLWAVLDGSGPLLLEEPELSLHPEVVRFIPLMLWRVSRRKQRQIFISTHSPDLLGDKGIAPDETLLLHPSGEGTQVELARNNQAITALLEEGLSIADAVLPAVAPKRADQLALFD